MRLKNKNVLIIGGDRGIGAAIVKKFVHEDAFVIFTYNQGKENAEKILQKYGKEKIEIFHLNIADRDEIAKVINDIILKYQNIDILVNNAGITKDGYLMLMKAEDWNSVIDINLNSYYYVIKNILPNMIKNRYGSIVNVSSVSGSLGVAGQANYSASKAGLNALTRCLAKEVGAKNIRVNSVAPGYIETDMLKKVNDKLLQGYKNQIPARRFGNTEEVANVVAFLASDEASYVNGQVIAIDGGLT